MKKIIYVLMVILAILVFCTSCSSENKASQLETTTPTTEVETTVIVSSTSKASAEYVKIEIPKCCVIGTDEDICKITDEEKANGIFEKEKSDGGGVILSISSDDYEGFVNYSKNTVKKELDALPENYSKISKVEYNDEITDVIIYADNNYEKTSDSLASLTCAMDSIFYQSVLKKTDTDNLQCHIKVMDNKANTVLNEFTFPEQ